MYKMHMCHGGQQVGLDLLPCIAVICSSQIVRFCRMPLGLPVHPELAGHLPTPAHTKTAVETTSSCICNPDDQAVCCLHLQGQQQLLGAQTARRHGRQGERVRCRGGSRAQAGRRNGDLCRQVSILPAFAKQTCCCLVVVRLGCHRDLPCLSLPCLVPWNVSGGV